MDYEIKLMDYESHNLINMCTQAKNKMNQHMIEDTINVIYGAYFHSTTMEEFNKKIGCISDELKQVRKILNDNLIKRDNNSETMVIDNETVVNKKKNVYHPIQHFSNTLDHILGCNTKIPEEVLDRIKSEYIKISNPNIYSLKQIIKKLKYTRYMKYISTIYQAVDSNVRIPIYTDNDKKILSNVFIGLTSSMLQYIDKNAPYAPFYIDQVVQHIFGSDKQISHLILSKSPKTQKRLIGIWNNVCGQISSESHKFNPIA